MSMQLAQRSTPGGIALATIQCNAPPSSALLLQLVQRSPKWRNASESQAPPRFAQQLPHLALHLLRDAAPDQNGCTAYGSGAPPTPTSPNADTHTSPGAGSAPSTTATHYLDRHCATYSPAQRPPSSATLPLTSPTAASIRQPAAYAPPPSAHSPIPHVIP